MLLLCDSIYNHLRKRTDELGATRTVRKRKEPRMDFVRVEKPRADRVAHRVFRAAFSEKPSDRRLKFPERRTFACPLPFRNDPYALAKRFEAAKMRRDPEFQQQLPRRAGSVSSAAQQSRRAAIE